MSRTIRMDPRQWPLGLEDGISYIASQTIGECYFDTLENLLTFADVFRLIFAGLAERLIQEGHGADLMQRAPYIRDRLAAELGIVTPNASMISFLNFCVEAMRRYVLVKYAERGLDEATISGWFGGIPIESDCMATFGITTPPPDSRRYWPLHARERSRSINRLAGIHAAITGARAVGSVTTDEHGQYMTAREPYISFLTLVQRSIRQIPRLNSMILTQNVRYTRGGIDVMKPFNYPDYTWGEALKHRFSKKQPINVNVIAAYYKLKGVGTGHAIAFLRYRGEYYYCDNQVGIAQPCYNDEVGKKRFIANIGQRVTYVSENYVQRGDGTTPNRATNLFIIIHIGDYQLPTIISDKTLYDKLTRKSSDPSVKSYYNLIKSYERTYEYYTKRENAVTHFSVPTPICCSFPRPNEVIETITLYSYDAVIFQVRAGQEKLLDVAPVPPLPFGAQPGWRPEGAAAGAGGGAEAPAAAETARRRKSNAGIRRGGSRRTLRKVRGARHS